MVTESMVVLLPQPKNDTIMIDNGMANRNARTLRRPAIELSSSLKRAGTAANLQKQLTALPRLLLPSV